MYISMPRTRVNYRLDDRVLEALNELAGKGQANKFIEGLLIDFLQKTGRLPTDFEPLPEARGGKRDKAGKKKRSTTDEEPIASSEVEPIVGAARWQSKPETLFTEGISEG